MQLQHKPHSSNNRPQYKFYATLLDSFTRYLRSDDDEALQEFLDKVNRVPFVSAAAAQGTAFNDLVDKIRKGQLVPWSDKATAGHLPVNAVLWIDAKGNVSHTIERSGLKYKFNFKWSIVEKFVNLFKADRTHDQVYIEAILPTRKGNVLLYGYMDEIMHGGVMSDIKGTSKYEFPKFLHNWQHIVYPYCMHANDIIVDQFRYDITDYNHYYKEEYIFDFSRDTPRLVEICERLIDFLESQKDKITDKKVFALDEAAATIPCEA